MKGALSPYHHIVTASDYSRFVFLFDELRRLSSEEANSGADQGAFCSAQRGREGLSDRVLPVAIRFNARESGSKLGVSVSEMNRADLARRTVYGFVVLRQVSSASQAMLFSCGVESFFGCHDSIINLPEGYVKSYFPESSKGPGSTGRPFRTRRRIATISPALMRNRA